MSFRLFFLFVLCIIYVVVAEDLYGILGVAKSASPRQIKNAYKKLARQWHPDKNKDDREATEKFMKINEAYETLSDPEKRSDYDNFGTTSAREENHMRREHDPFAHFFGGGGGFGRGRESSFGKHRMTFMHFQNKVLAESHYRPFVVYAYTDFCFGCMQTEHIWEKITQDLHVMGLGYGSVHANMDGRLVSKLHISQVPQIVAVVNGRIQHFSQRIGVQELRSFIRSLFPSDIITKLDDSNYVDYINGWHDNRVRAVLFDDRREPPLRFLAAAYAFRDRISCAFASFKYADIREFSSKYRASKGMETLMIFNDDPVRPAATLSTRTLARSSIDELLDAHKYLILPRLSSQPIFDDICPVGRSKSTRVLCVVLLTMKSQLENQIKHLISFRKYSQSYENHQQLRFAYMHADSQQPFIQALSVAEPENYGEALKVAILWRKESKKVTFKLLTDGWSLKEGKQNESMKALDDVLATLLSNKGNLPYTVTFPQLINEHAASLWTRILNRLLDWYDSWCEYLSMHDSMMVVTVLIAITMVVCVGFFMHSLMGEGENPSWTQSEQYMEARARHRAQRAREEMNTRSGGNSSEPNVPVNELRPETFQLLINKLEPGQRTVLLLVDQESRHLLLSQFVQVIFPYSRGDAFKFAFMHIDNYLSWYKHLLEETLDFSRSLDGINPKNCIGTVLAINGHRKNYCIYHGALAAEERRNKFGDFIGFNDDSDSDDEDFVAEQHLLDGLIMWMERLCEGSLKRFRVDYWPEMDE
ncbi:unnamed protein product [Owenia fusiformis]|uniref:Uncharacterized protein n=1 Tax=Owenia fusiformis TaxID=6347 RepID=A0A8J1TPH8_OWEFU|nr:unnamed protein product [Owenia fusiformis]